MWWRRSGCSSRRERVLIKREFFAVGSINHIICPSLGTRSLIIFGWGINSRPTLFLLPLQLTVTLLSRPVNDCRLISSVNLILDGLPGIIETLPTTYASELWDTDNQSTIAAVEKLNSAKSFSLSWRWGLFGWGKPTEIGNPERAPPMPGMWKTLSLGVGEYAFYYPQKGVNLDRALWNGAKGYRNETLHLTPKPTTTLPCSTHTSPLQCGFRVTRFFPLFYNVDICEGQFLIRLNFAVRE